MHTLTRFAFTPARLLVGGYVFGACVLAAHAQAQHQVVPPPPTPTAPVSNPPSPNAVPQPAPVSPVAPSPTTPGSSVAPPANESTPAEHIHERTSHAKRAHRRGRSIMAGQTIPFSRRRYWDPRPPSCPVWDFPYGPDRWQWWWVEGRPWWLLGCP